MIRFRSVPAVLVTALAAALALAAGETPAPGGPPLDNPPRVVLDEWLLDVGEVVQGEPIEATFVLKNEGGHDLEILEAKPT